LYKTPWEVDEMHVTNIDERELIKKLI